MAQGHPRRALAELSHLIEGVTLLSPESIVAPETLEQALPAAPELGSATGS